MKNFGKIVLTVDVMMKNRGLSKTKLCQRAEMQMTQLGKYLKNDIALLDIDVLARICNALDCDISDIMIYKKD